MSGNKVSNQISHIAIIAKPRSILTCIFPTNQRVTEHMFLPRIEVPDIFILGFRSMLSLHPPTLAYKMAGQNILCHSSYDAK